ncbi:MAG: NADH-quinone oxidoreductase subunit J [Deltaproteobacteria bacterium]|nr:NADH-quinone oxidoreductase subunit J [Deltaproteobacteria bacterium]
MAQANLLEQIYFALCALLAVAGAIGTVAFPNPIRGALSLLFSIVAIAGLYLQLHAPFLAAIQLIVYAGAVVVLFLFVIMLIGPDAVPPKDSRALVARVGGGVAATAISLLVLMVLARKTFPRIAPAQAEFGSVESIGALLFTDYLVPFEVASFLLMVAIVGAVAVARGKQPDPQLAKGKTQELVPADEAGLKDRGER